MASHLLGVPVTVTLKYPPNGLVQGLVAHIDEKTSTLSLRNVFLPNSGQRFPEYNINSAQIADITVTQASENLPPAPAALKQQSHPVPQPPLPPNRPVTNPYPNAPFVPSQVHPQPFAQHEPPRQSPLAARPPQSVIPPAQPARKPFVDPAILSMGRKPSIAHSPAVEIPTNRSTPNLPQEAPSTPVKPIAEAAAAPLPANSSPFIGMPAGKSDSAVKRSQSISATLSEPFAGLQIAQDKDEDESDGPEAVAVYDMARRTSLSKSRAAKPVEGLARAADPSKKTRRGKGKKKEAAAASAAAAQQPPYGVESTPEAGKKAANGGFKAKGWRQTPLLQEGDGVDSPRTPGIISGKVGLAAINASNRKTRKQKALEATNGWATEDATDIQELPDFDFVGNLSKFDKRAVFEQIRNEDTTADEDRLVTFNRLPRPGTYGGKNLHPTENVLDGPKTRVHSNSFSSTDSDEDVDSGRNSRRAMSRASNRRAPHRSGSGLQGDDLPHPTASTLLSRGKASFSRPTYASSSHVSGSPKPSGRATPPDSPSPFFSPMTQNAPRISCLRVASSNRTCHCITPGGMMAVEEMAEVEFGLTEDILAESSGRGIAEVALSNINPGGRRLAREAVALNSKPVVVVLVGNHRTGARAVAAARHLHLRGPRVMVAVLGYERNPADWDKDVRRQVQLLKKFGGLVRSWHDIEEALKKLEAPPELIIDALLGRNREFEALGDMDKKEVMKIIGWANKSRAGVLAVEGPSGVGGSTGEISILEGEPLEVRAKHVVCLGAPRSGILRALQNGVGRGDPEWTIWVVDLGLNRPWRKSGVPAADALTGGRAYGVPFGGEWVVQVRFVESGTEAERGR